VAAQLALLSIPATQSLFRIGAVPALDIALAMALALVPVTLLEVGKLVQRRVRHQRPAAPTRPRPARATATR
jgi:hypothetical protein